MAGPDTTSWERPDLGEYFAQFPMESEASGWVGLLACPVKVVPEKSGVFSVITSASLLEDVETKRAPGGGYHQSNYQFTQDSWLTQEHGAVEYIDDNQKRQYMYTIDMERMAAIRVRELMMRKLEKAIADVLFDSSSTFASYTAAASTAWTTPASAVPVTDVKTALNTFEGNCGMSANAMVMTRKALRALTQCSQVIDRVKYAGFADPTLPMTTVIEALKQLFEIENIFIADKFRNSAKKGQTVTFARIWDDTKCGIYRIPTTEDLAEPCVARTFIWGGDGAGRDGVFEQYRDEDKRSDALRFRNEWQVKTLRAQCGYVLTAVTA